MNHNKNTLLSSPSTSTATATATSTNQLQLEPEIYQPVLNNENHYVDNIPSTSWIAQHNGIRCECGGSRKNTVYMTNPTFTKHTRTAHHQKWLEQVNTNRLNYFVECQRLKICIQQQQRQLVEKDNLLVQKEMIIQLLTKELREICREQNDKGSLMLLDLMSFDRSRSRYFVVTFFY